MGYLIGNRMALLHPPKTGGIWVRNACASVGLPWERYGRKCGHKCAADHPSCQHADEPPPEERITMMFVRHPVTWLKSFWMFHERTGWEQYTDAPGFIFYACKRHREDFQTFIARYLDRMPGAVGRMFARYERHADLIGKVESLVPDLTRFVQSVHPAIDPAGIDGTSRLNASPAEQKLMTNYAPGQVDKVRRAESEFMERHGYHK